MGTFTLTDQKLFMGGYDFTGRMNQVAIDHEAEAEDDTVFGDNTRSRAGGLKIVTVQAEGFFDADPYDAQAQANLGLANLPLTIGAQGGAVGDVARLTRIMQGKYTPFAGAVGEMAKFSLEAMGQGLPLVTGELLENAAKTATYNGTARQLGAVAAGQRLYAALHVLAVSGTTPTLDVTVESDNASGFVSPATRLTFTQQTAIGSEWQQLDGAITDDWFRIAATIGGASPSFLIALSVGIA